MNGSSSQTLAHRQFDRLESGMSFSVSQLSRTWDSRNHGYQRSLSTRSRSKRLVSSNSGPLPTSSSLSTRPFVHMTCSWSISTCSRALICKTMQQVLKDSKTKENHRSMMIGDTNSAPSKGLLVNQLHQMSRSYNGRVGDPLQSSRDLKCATTAHMASESLSHEGCSGQHIPVAR